MRRPHGGVKVMIPESVRQELFDLVESRDRSDPLSFVGRDSEMQFLDGLVSRAAAQDKSPPLGAIRVVQGVPGTGKTALCNEFGRRLLERGEVNGRPVLCASISTADLSRPPVHLIRTINKRCFDAHVKRGAMRTRLGGKGPSADELAGAVVQRLFRGKAWEEIRESAHGLSEASTLASCIDVYTERVWAEGAVVVLMLDEAQNCNVHSQQAKENACDLYAGDHKARLPLLCFGLPNTKRVLNELGISRLTGQSVRELGRLLPGEGREVLERTLDQVGLSEGDDDWLEHVRSLGMTADEWRTWRKALVGGLEAASDDFPQHLTAGLMAACQGILDMEEGRKFDDAMLNDIAARHQEWKDEYYQGRLHSPALERHGMAFGAICKLSERQGGALSRQDARAIIMAGDDEGAPVSDGRASDALQAAIDKGVFGCDEDSAGRPVTPPLIPSMQTHLQKGFERCLADGLRPALTIQAAIDELAPEPTSENEEGKGLSM